MMHSNQVPDDPLAQFCSFLIKIESAINVRLFQWSETKPTQQEFNLYFENMIKQIHTAPITDHALGDFLNPEKANTPRKTWNDLTLKPLEFIKQEYKKQLLKIHPDKNPGQEEKYTPIFQAFCKANEILTKIAESLARIESSKLQYLQTQLQTKQVDKKTAGKSRCRKVYPLESFYSGQLDQSIEIMQGKNPSLIILKINDNACYSATVLTNYLRKEFETNPNKPPKKLNAILSSAPSQIGCQIYFNLKLNPLSLKNGFELIKSTLAAPLNIPAFGMQPNLFQPATTQNPRGEKRKAENDLNPCCKKPR